MEKREVNVINGMKKTSITPDLSEEETFEVAKYIVNGLRSILDKRKQK